MYTVCILSLGTPSIVFHSIGIKSSSVDCNFGYMTVMLNDDLRRFVSPLH
jgi:hypothetical protein